MPNLLYKGKLAIITPDKDQEKQSEDKWKEVVSQVEVVSASPYTEEDELSEAIDILKDSHANIIVMDCMGYTGEMKKRVSKETGKMVVLSRTIVARVVGEILNR
ncbi:AroM family protein [Acetoanaerobium noterae]|uniref:AroM family protein n=1 Tax=Acetoanaerobium noterae TaxID=745369 RepID=UPI0032220555